MKKLITYTIIALLNLGLWLYVLINSIPIIHLTFLFLTFQNFTLNTFYFTIMCIYEILSHKSKNMKTHKFYLFIKNRLFKFVFLMSCSVSAIYWLLYLGGETLMRQEDNIVVFMTSVYLHFIVTVYVFVDIFLTERKYNHAHFYADFIISSAYMCIYVGLNIILAKTTDIVVYNYLSLPMRMVIFITIITSIIGVNVYLLYHKLMTWRNKDSLPTQTSASLMHLDTYKF
jgi:hypothetical protein